jgi:DNA repair protein RadA/Sms
LAVLHRHCGIALGDQDVFANVVGGVRITETGADLALLLAVLGSFRDRVLPRELIVFGELGLTGELRPVANGQERLREAAKHGFKYAIVPFANRPKEAVGKMKVHGVKTLSAALEVLQSL